MYGTESAALAAITRVFEAAGRHSSGWWAVPKVAITDRNDMSDIDVLVGVPGSGLLIVEVKGWEDFRVEAHGRWSHSGRAGKRVEKQDPFDQASRQIFLLKNLLATGRDNGQLPMGGLPRIGACVLFGNLRRNSLSHVPLQNQAHCIFAEDWCPQTQPTESEAVKVLTNLRRILGDNPRIDGSNNDGARLAQVHRALLPQTGVPFQWHSVDESHRRLTTIVENAMSAQAEVLLDQAKNFYFEGAAGTGKTVLALAMGLQQYRRTGNPSLFVCFSPHLAEELREGAHVDPAMVQIRTPEELLTDWGAGESLDEFRAKESLATSGAGALASLAGISLGAGVERAYLGSDAFWDVLLATAADKAPAYGAVMVDEAQDLWEPAFGTLSALVDSGGAFAVFCDPLQLTRRERAGLSWTQPESTLGGMSRVLRRNYRNGDRIIDAVEEAFQVEYERPERGSPPGTVETVFYSSREPMAFVTSRELLRLQSSGLSPAVLVTGANTDERTALTDAAIEYRSVDSFKGLERRAVVLIVGRDSSPLDPTNEDLYVGMTRGTVHLTVIHHPEFIHPALPRPEESR